jgi:hypothetical protein
MGRRCGLVSSSAQSIYRHRRRDGQKFRGSRPGEARPTLIFVDDPKSIEQCVSPLLR